MKEGLPVNHTRAAAAAPNPHFSRFPSPQNQYPTRGARVGYCGDKCLTMTYFHRRPSTIIGANAFHGPVRDGKAWDHLAMVVNRNWLRMAGAARQRRRRELCRSTAYAC